MFREGTEVKKTVLQGRVPERERESDLYVPESEHRKIQPEGLD